MNEKQNGKLVDTLKTHFADEKKITESDAKNSVLVIEGRKQIADAYVELALDKNTIQEDKERLLNNASMELDKAQSESVTVRLSNERRSVRKNIVIGGILTVVVACAAPQIYRLAKDEVPKLMSQIKNKS